MLVQGAVVTATDLQVIVPGEEAVTAPDGYRLVGWADSAAAAEAQFVPGQQLDLEAYMVKHLYAIWEELQIEMGAEITVLSESKTVEVKIPSDWCDSWGIGQAVIALYDPNSGKMISARSAEYRAGEDISIEVRYRGETLPSCKIILMDDNYAPLGKGDLLDLSNYL